MSGRHLLDTNIIVAIFKQETQVLQRLAAATEVFVPVIAIGELYYGAQHSGQVAKNLAQVQGFAAQSKILSCDLATADYYGQIKQELKQKGNPIPENDIWIAAIARQHSLTVVSHDQHFQQVPSLDLEAW